MLSSFFDNILTKQGWKQVVKVVVLPFCTIKSYKKIQFHYQLLKKGYICNNKDGVVHCLAKKNL